MRATLISLIALFSLLLAGSGHAASSACLSCHDFGPDSPVHPMLGSQHGDTEKGCASCHGPSEDHMKRPTMASPDVSFGPRWTATVADQDGQCLDCHEKNIAEHWQESLHMANNLSCIACHDMHKTTDKVLDTAKQSEVCTVCHKVQKEGMHALPDKMTDNPPCTTCHNPHADQSPVAMMLENRSAGCRNCHDLVGMSDDSKVSVKAKSYHKVMAQQDRTCVDCHQGVAHGPTDAVEPFVPLPTSRRQVTLFYPGKSDIDWILSEHPGAQPFRQGSNCQQCHRGEEASMGLALGGNLPNSRQVEISFSTGDGNLQLTASWEGSADDESFAMMWGDGGNGAFRRGGCWAACHADMPGMSRDRGQDLGKYLSSSRQQQQRIGQPPLVRNDEELWQLIAAGDFVEMWRIPLQEPGKASSATLLAKLDWHSDSNLKASANFNNGRWTATLRRPLQDLQSRKNFAPGRRYTFGIALHGEDRKGAAHWVSLPMTFSLDGDDTDFLAN